MEYMEYADYAIDIVGMGLVVGLIMLMLILTFDRPSN